ncbi:MAG: Smr/MutS family protein [Gemmatimonadaceae bacterium]
MRRARVPNALYRAFDEAQFGDARTLNVRDGLPTGAEAAARTDAWLRLKQVEGVREVLVITGRGTHSVSALPVIKTHVARRIAALRRAGVVASVTEHTPGSYVVRLSPMSSMLAAAERVSPRSNETRVADALPRSMASLTPATQRLLRDLAERTLASLGVRNTTSSMITDEMERQTTLLTRSMPRDADRDGWIRRAALRVLNDLE